jgi:phage-related protein
MQVPDEKTLVLLHGELRTPPLSAPARQEAGFLLRKLQQGKALSLPHSRPMPSIGARCHELRINEGDKIWRIIYRIDVRAVLVLEVFGKKTQKTPQKVIEVCKARLREYDE